MWRRYWTWHIYLFTNFSKPTHLLWCKCTPPYERAKMGFPELKRKTTVVNLIIKALWTDDYDKLNTRWVNNKRKYEQKINSPNWEQNVEQSIVTLSFAPITRPQLKDPSQDIRNLVSSSQNPLTHSRTIPLYQFSFKSFHTMLFNPSRLPPTLSSYIQPDASTSSYVNSHLEPIPKHHVKDDDMDANYNKIATLKLILGYCTKHDTFPVL